jgi:16S rRNA (guanine1207-N2)-methyltransferase
VATVPSPDGPQEPGVTAPGHYFADEPAAASRRATVRLTLPERTLELVTDRGVFSPDRIDPGTKLLLMELPDLPAGPVVDVGCGYGPIACAVAARRPGHEMWAVDVNRRARALTAENARRLGLDVRVAAPEDVPADLRVAAIVSNPPIRIGKAALHELLGTWLDRLAPEGRAWLVVNKHLGADSLASWLSARGHAVERLRSRQGYRVLAVSGSSPDPRAT